MEPRRRVHFLTLGCPKNQVDSEVMLGVLTRAGHEIVLDPDAADVLVVNTCAFIGPAKEESIDAILDAAREKAAREGRRLVVTGCLAQRYRDELVRELPEVDAFVGTGELTRIAEAVNGAAGEGMFGGPASASSFPPHELPAHGVSPRVRTGAWWTAYLKVSEGCDHRCSFCIIPTIRGRHESRPVTDLLAEAESLVAGGAVELNLIAQDLTAYGRDRDDGVTLARLLHTVAMRVPAARWLRLLYAYPASVTDELLEVIATEPAVCKYLDMPLQHIADDMLRAMRRERGGATIRRLLRRIRAAVPGIAMRSSFIVGFPGETEAHVDELCDFLEEAELDRVGVFRYSQEEGTHAAGLPGQLAPAVIRRRRERVMATQARVAARRARAQVGRVLEALVEGEGKRGTLVGRSRDQAPEIDGILHLRGEAAPGDLVLARITGADTYDLHGDVLAPGAVDSTGVRL